MKVIYSDENDLLASQSPDMPNKGGLSTIITCYNNFVVPYHSHDFNELVIILGGTGKHIINEASYNMISGDVFVLKGADTHSLKDTKGLKFVNIAFTVKKLELLGTDIKKLPGFHALFLFEPFYRKQHNFQSRLRLGTADLMYASELADDMEKEYLSKDPASESMMSTYFIQLVIFLSRRYGEFATNVPATIFALASTISYIESNYTEVTSLKKLAQMANLSVNQFLRIFKKTFNTTPMNYLKQLRIRKACEMMRSSNTSITDIAYAVGITDSNYFSRVFRSVIGKSPWEYRQNLYTHK